MERAWRNELYVQWVARVITLFREDEGRLPEDLAEIFAHRLPSGRRGDASSDLFGHPLRYEPAADGRGFEISSPGMDGAPGGKGADADVRLAVR